MHRVMKYCLHTPKRGLKLKPKGVWDGQRDFMFYIKDLSDSEYAKDESRRSLNGWKAELFATVLCAHDMICAMRILNVMGLKVELPMILYLDNKGAKDF
eukprot:3499286-Ditylum_brightwellii.AAC.1